MCWVCWPKTVVFIFSQKATQKTYKWKRFHAINYSNISTTTAIIPIIPPRPRIINEQAYSIMTLSKKKLVEHMNFLTDPIRYYKSVLLSATPALQRLLCQKYIFRVFKMVEFCSHGDATRLPAINLSTWVIFQNSLAQTIMAVWERPFCVEKCLALVAVAGPDFQRLTD